MATEAEAELNVGVLQEIEGLIQTFKELHNMDTDCGNLRKLLEERMEVIDIWRGQQAEKHVEHLGRSISRVRLPLLARSRRLPVISNMRIVCSEHRTPAGSSSSGRKAG